MYAEEEDIFPYSQGDEEPVDVNEMETMQEEREKPACRPTVWSSLLWAGSVFLLLLLLTALFRSYQNQLLKKQADYDRKLIELLENQQNIFRNQQVQAEQIRTATASVKSVHPTTAPTSPSPPNSPTAVTTKAGEGGCGSGKPCHGFQRRDSPTTTTTLLSPLQTLTRAQTTAKLQPAHAFPVQAQPLKRL